MTDLPPNAGNFHLIFKSNCVVFTCVCLQKRRGRSAELKRDTWTGSTDSLLGDKSADRSGSATSKVLEEMSKTPAITQDLLGEGCYGRPI